MTFKRQWLFWLLLAVIAWFIFHNFAAIRQTETILRHGHWEWIFLAAALQAIYYYLYSRLYKAVFRIVDFNLRLREILPLVMGSMAINITAPTGGTAGTVLFMDHAAHKGDSPGKAGAGSLLVFVIHLFGLSFLLFYSILYLSWIDHLESYEWIGTLLLLLSILGFCVMLQIGLHWPKQFRNFFQLVRKVVNSVARLFGNKEAFSEKWIDTNTASFTEAARSITEHPDGLNESLGIDTLMHIVGILSLYAVFLAFDQSISFGALVAGYSIGALFLVISPTPQGIGVVEGVIALFYSSLGVHATTATFIALAYRGVSFWLPLAIGFVSLRRIRSFQSHPRHDQEADPVETVVE